MSGDGDGVFILAGLLVVAGACLAAPWVIAAWEPLTKLQQTGLMFLGFIGVMVLQAFATPPRRR